MKRFTNLENYMLALTGGFDFLSKPHIIHTITKNDIMFANGCVSTRVYIKTLKLLAKTLESFK